MPENNLRIVFMGTPHFAVESLKALLNDGQNIVGVITSPDKPAGRGQKLISSPVKLCALENSLKLLQPANLKSNDFITELSELKADLQVVVAFRILPENVWNMPGYGTFNLHASLLPDYRGAAPINWAIINGETTTGVTTFFIDHNIDTGKIIFQEETDINPHENAGSLHDRLMQTGARLVVKTVRAINHGTYPQIDQSKLIRDKELNPAPKIHKENCKINWSNDIKNLYDFIRGLSPYPAAWTEIITDINNTLSVKIFESEIDRIQHQNPIGRIESDNKTYLRVAVNGGYLNITSLQMAGKKRLGIADFLKGFHNVEKCKLAMK
jgi:methionyl-tRNA formyltransferase